MSPSRSIPRAARTISSTRPRSCWKALAELTDRLKVTYHTVGDELSVKRNVTRSPSILIAPDTYRIRYTGAPVGEEGRSFLVALMMASTGKPFLPNRRKKDNGWTSGEAGYPGLCEPHLSLLSAAGPFRVLGRGHQAGPRVRRGHRDLREPGPRGKPRVAGRAADLHEQHLHRRGAPARADVRRVIAFAQGAPGRLDADLGRAGGKGRRHHRRRPGRAHRGDLCRAGRARTRCDREETTSAARS